MMMPKMLKLLNMLRYSIMIPTMAHNHHNFTIQSKPIIQPPVEKLKRRSAFDDLIQNEFPSDNFVDISRLLDVVILRFGINDFINA